MAELIRVNGAHDPAEALALLRANVALRESEFMRLYLRGPLGVRYNGLECAKAVGYDSTDDNSLRVIASRLLHQERNLLKIKRAIDRNEASLDRMVHELSCMAFYNAAD